MIGPKRWFSGIDLIFKGSSMDLGVCTVRMVFAKRLAFENNRKTAKAVSRLWL